MASSIATLAASKLGQKNTKHVRIKEPNKKMQELGCVSSLVESVAPSPMLQKSLKRDGSVKSMKRDTSSSSMVAELLNMALW